MPQSKWSDKREREYAHIRDSLEKKGNHRAEEIAARTVNKDRAQNGEADRASASSVNDVSPSHRGGKRSHSSAEGRTRDQLYTEAQRKNVPGRSTMSKAELLKAVG